MMSICHLVSFPQQHACHPGNWLGMPHTCLFDFLRQAGAIWKMKSPGSMFTDQSKVDIQWNQIAQSYNTIQVVLVILAGRLSSCEFVCVLKTAQLNQHTQHKYIQYKYISYTYIYFYEFKSYTSFGWIFNKAQNNNFNELVKPSTNEKSPTAGADPEPLQGQRHLPSLVKDAIDYPIGPFKTAWWCLMEIVSEVLLIENHLVSYEECTCQVVNSLENEGSLGWDGLARLLERNL